MGSGDEAGVYIVSDLYEVEAGPAVAPRGHLKNWALNVVRQIDIGCRWVLAFKFFHILFGLASVKLKEMTSEGFLSYKVQINTITMMDIM